MGEGAVSPIYVKVFLSQKTKTFRWGTLLCFRKFLVSKNVKDESGGRVSWLSVKLVLCHTTKFFLRRTPLMLRKFPPIQTLWIKREAGIMTFCQFVLCHSTKNLRRGTLLYFRKVLVANIVRDERDWGSRFSVEIVFSKTSEAFRRCCFYCVTNFGSRNT